MRIAVRVPQLEEQLVEVPTIVSYSSLQRTMEQHVDIPVPGGGGRNVSLQFFSLDSVQQRCILLRNVFLSGLWSGMLIFPAEAFKIFALDRVRPLLRTFQLVFMKLWILDEPGEGFFFALSPSYKKCEVGSALASVRGGQAAGRGSHGRLRDSSPGGGGAGAAWRRRRRRRYLLKKSLALNEKEKEEEQERRSGESAPGLFRGFHALAGRRRAFDEEREKEEQEPNFLEVDWSLLRIAMLVWRQLWRQFPSPRAFLLKLGDQIDIHMKYDIHVSGWLTKSCP